MIHYHGTPITPREQLMRMAGRHLCISFAQPQDLATGLQIMQSLMFDNGAFSAFTRGAVFDVDGYYRWLEPILYPPHWAVVPDVIDGEVEDQRRLIAAWPYPIELGAPVWHLHEPIDWLLELADGWPRLCLGSSGQYWQLGTPSWCGRMDAAFNALDRRHARLPWVHGLRMLGQSDGPWPLASADSTNIAQNWKRDHGCAECKAARLDIVNPALIWKRREQQEMSL